MSNYCDIVISKTLGLPCTSLQVPNFTNVLSDWSKNLTPSGLRSFHNCYQFLGSTSKK